MKPEQDPSARMDAAVQKLGDRLVELKLAEHFVWDTQRKVSGFVWTAEGLRLCEMVKRIYDVPKRSPREFTLEELVALTVVLLSEVPFIKPPKGGI